MFFCSRYVENIRTKDNPHITVPPDFPYFHVLCRIFVYITTDLVKWRHLGKVKDLQKCIEAFKSRSRICELYIFFQV